MIDRIKFQNNLTITMANTKVKDKKIGNWLGAVSYMSTKIIKVFGVKKGNKNQGRGSNGRRILEVEVCGRGHGGRGLGNGWGGRGRC